MKRDDFISRYMKTFAIAIATFAVLAGLASHAQGEIVYHSANITISDSTYNLDLNGDGITDFTIESTQRRCGTLCTVIFLGETPAQGNGAILGPLSRGQEIGPNQSFDGNGATMSWFEFKLVCNKVHCWGVHSSGGLWLGKKGYLGLSFQVDGQTYYGWASLSCPKPGGSGTLLGYAYETIPGRAIKAGETSYAWFSSTSVNFGTVTVGTTLSKSVTLTNLGPTTLTITNATITGTNAADFASENGNPPCAGSLAAGTKCTLTFTFTPSISGKEMASYSAYDDGGVGPQNLNLAGKGR
jgi:Abnormal spindle-like microcephaly-assoc'd, ASPM-SPD-2-Hydin